MRLREMREIVRLRSVELDATKRRLASCHDVSDLRRAAKRRIPRPVFDYVDGAADEERTSTANVAAFRQWRFQPRVLADVSEIDTSVTLFGSPLPVPMLLAPTGYTRMMHADGEAGAARAAIRAGIPYTLSTMATTGIEELRDAVAPVPAAASAAVPDSASGSVASGPAAPDPTPGSVASGPAAPDPTPGSASPGFPSSGPSASAPAADPALWFQLYILKNRDRAYELVDRAWSSGFRVLVVTVDTVVAGNRLRDIRNGLTMPPSLSPSTVVSVAGKPGYWLRLLSGPPLEYSNFTGHSGAMIHQTAEFFDPAIDWSDIEALRSRWPGRILVKGPLGPADARRAIDLGADGIQLSNHGGRQLDRCVPTADLIAPAREAVGPSVPIVVDSGIRSGVDIATALALGADAVALGRAYVYGLMAGGEAGVDHALSILAREFRTTMRLLGVTSVSDLRKRGAELITR